MVNVPPIPPLLCSTPPPIDFGEDDEDVDVLPPTLDGVDDDGFGNFLTVDNIKTNELLPSPRPPSICDLPPVSIYDGLIPSDEEVIKSPASPTNNNIKNDSKNSPKSINVTEAFNFNVKNSNESIDNKSHEEFYNSSNSTKDTENITNTSQVIDLTSNNPEECPLNTNPVETLSSSKNLNDLTIDTTRVNTKCNKHTFNKSCIQNIVSIEDLEDDLSDDELYSPKTPKNFIETDNLNDYFKIEEIKPTNEAEIIEKSIPKDIDTKSLDSVDNNESASIGNDNENEFRSFSSNSFINNNFDEPPPLQDDTTNSIDEDDDFGEFADFQDFSTAITPAEQTQNFVNNTVPVNDINNKQHDNNDLEYNGFNDFIDYNKSKDYTNVNSVQVETIKSEDDVDIEKSTNESEIKSNEETDNEFQQFSSHSTKEVGSLENSKNPEIITQGISNNNNENTSILTTQDCCQNNSILKEENLELENSFGEFNSALKSNNEDDDFGNFAEFNKPTEIQESENTEETIKTNVMDDDEFDDFADFESHQGKPKLEEKSAEDYESNKHNNKEEEQNDDDDDDFGDFNTAQPITTTASNITQNKTSQNTTAAKIPLSSLHNLNERISKILELMFTPALNQTDEATTDEPKTHKIQDIPFTSVDAAKALEYQWLSSDTRHSFIRSLGIDSRNILFGENWNPSLPRFAANLSFNPLKPMKPVQSSNSPNDASSTLEPIPALNSLKTSSKSLEETGNNNKETLDLDWKSSSTTEQTIEAFKDINLNPSITQTTATSSVATTTAMPYVSNEPPPPETVSLTIFENTLDNEETFSKTPPISEMESVTTFSSALPTSTIEMDLPQTQIRNNLDEFEIEEVEENLKNALNINEVVVTSTFTGSFKETHIYTPPKTNDFEIKHTMTNMPSSSSLSPTKSNPIDFDYEKAAMGVIIDETVVKKEYRDVEYNPPFTMESLNKSATAKTDMFDTNSYNNTNANVLSSTETKMATDKTSSEEEQESNDEFSEFQSVSSEVSSPTSAVLPKTSTTSANSTKPLEVPKPAAVSHGGMILSPAILIPQAISMENQKPKIEWGDSTATINPEELARIEELFPEPKSLKSSNGSNSSQKSTPTHQLASTPSISATVANKELEGTINNVNVNDDDDDWSDFISVTVTNNTSTSRNPVNNNILTKSPVGSPFKQRSPIVTHKMPPSSVHTNSNNDDEWSEFVSSAPPSQQPTSYRVPQFNSGAWQNANFYNNPLSMYHKGPLNVTTPAAASSHSAQKSLHNNNNNYNTSNQQTPYQLPNNIPPAMLANNQQLPNNLPVYQHPMQQIHVMQNFSTAPVPTPERLISSSSVVKNNQFQSIGSAKVAPSIALIPDLGFVAPAIPTHTSFINSLPKPTINTKK
ncbi:aftiphilin isoform 1-T3 [Cochliomyia hominivorax]